MGKQEEIDDLRSRVSKLEDYYIAEEIYDYKYGK
jgi:hypothetical protein